MKKVFLYISIGIILLSIPITVFLVSKNQEMRKRAAPASSLSMTPTSVTKKVGETFSLDVKLDTGDNQVMTVQIVILYDPAKLKAEDITNGPLAPTISVSGKANPNGSASITVGAKDSVTPIKGTGTVARITMRTLAATTTPITIKFSPHPDTQANSLNESENVLIGLTGSNVTILNADGTAGSSIGASLTSGDLSTPSGTLTPTPTSLLTPTPTVIQASSGSSQATTSALLINSPANNGETDTTTPEFRGKGTPGSTITIVIHSDPVTATVTVDANGNWIYTPTTPLSPGTHTAEAMYTDPNTGETQTRTISFVVAEAAEETADVSTGSAVPVSGSVETTLLLIMIGCIFLLSGIAMPIYLR